MCRRHTSAGYDNVEQLAKNNCPSWSQCACIKVDDDNGDISGSKVKFNVNITDNLGATIYSNASLLIEGKTRSSFDKEFTFDIKDNFTGPYTVSVTRTTEAPDSVTDANDLFFKAIVGILKESFKYPATALLGLTFPSETFSSIPSISVDLRGLKIKVPNNRTEDLDGDVSYSGTWNGGLRAIQSTARILLGFFTTC